MQAPTHEELILAIIENVHRFGVGARVWLDEIKQVGNIDDSAALFSESNGRVLVSVGREDDVKFVGLCEARGIPVLRIRVKMVRLHRVRARMLASRFRVWHLGCLVSWPVCTRALCLSCLVRLKVRRQR